VKINALVCLGKLLPVMDKGIFQESMVPFLEKVSATDPGSLMAILGIYSEVFFGVFLLLWNALVFCLFFGCSGVERQEVWA
jgi:hypothetical protein